MNLPNHKTKIVCTIGPASRTPTVVEDLIQAGMNVARLNLSHGDYRMHADNIRMVRQAAARTGRIIDILMDLPGAKMRVGVLNNGPFILKKGQRITLTSRRTPWSSTVIPVEYKHLARSAKTGGIIYLSDGFIQLKVESIRGEDVRCRVIMGGPLLSHKGLNLPGAKLFVDAVTRRDLEIIEFGLRHGVNTFGLSFIENAGDIQKVRAFARRRNKQVNLVAKIERAAAIANFDEILQAADAIMIARGDMGVEIPIEDVPLVQKNLINRANVLGRPVITATQMLMSMTQNIRPTRAEVNDVANAIIDGTDAVMLSEETAIGKYPAETVRTMARIAAATESECSVPKVFAYERRRGQKPVVDGDLPIPDVISHNAVRAAQELGAKYILTPTTTGNTSRRVCRFKPPCWTLAFSGRIETCRFLSFSYGVHAFLVKTKYSRQDWALLRKVRMEEGARKGDTIIITERRLSDRAGETDSLGIITLE